MCMCVVFLFLLSGSSWIHPQRTCAWNWSLTKLEEQLRQWCRHSHCICHLRKLACKLVWYWKMMKWKHVFLTNCWNMWHVFVWTVLTLEIDWTQEEGVDLDEAQKRVSGLHPCAKDETHALRRLFQSQSHTDLWKNEGIGAKGKSKHHKENIKNHTGYRWL